MLELLITNAEAMRTVAPFVIAAAMVYAFATLTAGVVRTSSARSRHAAFWSPPRPARLLAVGKHAVRPGGAAAPRHANGRTHTFLAPHRHEGNAT